MSADWMAWVYRLFWGANLHHGFYDHPDDNPRQAMLRLKSVLAERARIVGGEEVLEVGFGFGESAMWLAREFGCSVTGITISPNEQRIGRYFARRRKVDRLVSFHLLDAADLSSWEPAQYDRIWCLECAEFLEDKPKLLKDWYALLKPGGRAVFCGLMMRDNIDERDRSQYIDPLLEGFGMPMFASLNENERWLEQQGYVDVQGEDITRQILPTGARSARILSRPTVRFSTRIAPKGIRRVLESFPRVFEAYRQGALRYGLFAASKPHAAPGLSAPGKHGYDEHQQENGGSREQ